MNVQIKNCKQIRIENLNQFHPKYIEYQIKPPSFKKSLFPLPMILQLNKPSFFVLEWFCNLTNGMAMKLKKTSIEKCSIELRYENRQMSNQLKIMAMNTINKQK